MKATNKISKGSSVQINKAGFESCYGRWADSSYETRVYFGARPNTPEEQREKEEQRRQDIAAGRITWHDDAGEPRLVSQDMRFKVDEGEELVVLHARCKSTRSWHAWKKLVKVHRADNPNEWFFVERAHVVLFVDKTETSTPETTPEVSPEEKPTAASIRAKYMKTVQVSKSVEVPTPEVTPENAPESVTETTPENVPASTPESLPMVVAAVAANIEESRVQGEALEALTSAATALLKAFVSGTKEQIESGFFGLKDAVEAATGEDPLA